VLCSLLRSRSAEEGAVTRNGDLSRRPNPTIPPHPQGSTTRRTLEALGPGATPGLAYRRKAFGLQVNDVAGAVRGGTGMVDRN
jgi:hypothetical protein